MGLGLVVADVRAADVCASDGDVEEGARERAVDGYLWLGMER